MADTLTVVGASVRAAVHSAVRAGFVPYAGDLYADLDLTTVAVAAECVTDYPQGLTRVCAGRQTGGWIYTGGLENHPELVGQLAALRPLWGNSAAVLQRVRQPETVTRVLRAAGLACPELRMASGLPPRDGNWLLKPVRSTGGLHISHCQPTLAPPCIPAAHATNASDPKWYLQQYIPGLPCAAAYLAADGQALLLGVSQQLIGTSWLGSNGFKYSGSIGPLHLTARVREQFVAVGRTLAENFGLIGLFGVDAVLADDVVWPVEVNPRYTASVEVLERAYGWAVLAAHVETCKSGRLQPSAGMLAPAVPVRQVCGKAVLFARQALKITRELAQSWLPASLQRHKNASPWPNFADVPGEGTQVPLDGPIVTLLAAGDNLPHVRRELRALARATESRIYEV